MIGTTTRDSGNRRSPLTLALAPRGSAQFGRVFTIRSSVYPDSNAPDLSCCETGSDMKLSYPYAIVRNDRLFVAYSVDGGRGGNRNSAELAIIPFTSLE